MASVTLTVGTYVKSECPYSARIGDGMASSQQTSQTSCNQDACAGKGSSHLSSTIEKLARAGEQAGFSVEETIAMLNAGVSIGALLDMIGYSLSHEALEFTHRR